jgi:hypothetical protein
MQQNCFSQPYPVDFFSSPLEIPLVFTGSFGELRDNHFHSGIDFGTQGIEGLTVLASAAGYVSRIKVSASGFGKVVYVTHPNGYTTVYAHLSRFNSLIDSIVKREQYTKESFETELLPTAESIKILKGAILGYSGNSGGSQSPHLHFEIRDTKTQAIINPVLFGLHVPDKFAPVIIGIKIYPMDRHSHVNFQNEPLYLEVSKFEDTYGLTSNEVIKVHGRIGIGIECHDPRESGDGKNGINKVELALHGRTIYSSTVNTFSFDDTRYINAHMDYAEYKTTQKRIQRCFVLPGNKLALYSELFNQGVIPIRPGVVYMYQFTITDDSGNESKISIETVGVEQGIITGSAKTRKQGQVIKLDPFSPSSYKTNDFIFEADKGTVYDSTEIIYFKSGNAKYIFSDIYHIHSPMEPVHKAYSIALKTRNLSDYLGGKSYIARIDTNGSQVFEGGFFKDGWIKGNVRSFGDFVVLTDTTPPRIAWLNETDFSAAPFPNHLKISINDPESGIESYRGTLNEKWIPMDYDAKSGLLTYVFESTHLVSDLKLELVVIDKRQNKSTITAVIKR